MMPFWKPMGVARAESSFSSSCLPRSWMSCCCFARRTGRKATGAHTVRTIPYVYGAASGQAVLP
jgi:hypothetical protein